LETELNVQVEQVQPKLADLEAQTKEYVARFLKLNQEFKEREEEFKSVHEKLEFETLRNEFGYRIKQIDLEKFQELKMQTNPNYTLKQNLAVYSRGHRGFMLSKLSPDDLADIKNYWGFVEAGRQGKLVYRRQAVSDADYTEWLLYPTNSNPEHWGLSEWQRRFFGLP
jgi:septal ring factor EnvC (AmiA/AmiB activator)